MLGLQSWPPKSKKSEVNILPCKIHRNGPAKVTKRFWSPMNEEDGSKTIYFRGRKLRGRRIKLPAKYRGVALTKTEESMPSTAQDKPSVQHPHSDDDDDMAEQDDQPEPVKLLKEKAQFDEITVWGHDRLPAADDTFVKGIEEWIAFAEAIHTTTAADLSQAPNKPSS